MQRIYCISGLGADHRLFKNLSIEHYELVPLPWAPYDRTDNMSSYADKMAKNIPGENAIIIGLSFGGMLAIEIAKKHPAWKIFLVSSAKTTSELGYNSSFLRWVSRKEVIPSIFFNRPSFIRLFLLGAQNAEEKKLISLIMRNSDRDFNRWSVNTLLTWNNLTYPQNITHIHGTSDKVIRPANVHPDHWIEKGSHIMIYNRAREVSKIISHCLSF